MSIAITSSAKRFSVSGVIFRDYINLSKVLTISLSKDRNFQRFDIMFYFSMGTKSASYTDETLLRVGPFPNEALDKANALMARMLLEKDKTFYLDEELLGKAEADAIEQKRLSQTEG
ncbi:MAG: hypothetical protein LBC85_09475 [Fibromonadaceae bacterium]|jgi:hypothetical protein|nr:hypothetical protein [Fibromonadaceae bacterium]